MNISIRKFFSCLNHPNSQPKQSGTGVSKTEFANPPSLSRSMLDSKTLGHGTEQRCSLQSMGQPLQKTIGISYGPDSYVKDNVAYNVYVDGSLVLRLPFDDPNKVEYGIRDYEHGGPLS